LTQVTGRDKAMMLISTPKRLLNHLEDVEARGRQLDFSDLKHLVLDECDRLLSLGFVAEGTQLFLLFLFFFFEFGCIHNTKLTKSK